MAEGGHHPRNRPPTLGTTLVDFYHNPVTVWAYSTPQPNTEVPAPTGGILLTWINFNPSMDTYYIHYKMWQEITYPFPNFNGCNVEVWEWIIISNFIPPYTCLDEI